MSDEFAIRVRELTIDRDGIRLLDGASIDVEPGERLGVVGGEDASRSAFAAALLGDVDPAYRVRGSVQHHTRQGDVVDLLDASPAATRRFRWRHVALVPAAGEVFNPVTSVGTTFEETLRAHDAVVGEGMDRAAAQLSDLGLDAATILQATPDEVGTGELELAALALALLLEPAVLLVEASERVLRRLAGGSLPVDDDLTIVATVPDPGPVAAVATRLAILYDGEFVEVGPTAAVVEDPDHPHTRDLLRLL